MFVLYFNYQDILLLGLLFLPHFSQGHEIDVYF